MLRLIGDLLIVYSAGVTVLSTVGHARTGWRTPMGRHLTLYTGTFAMVLVLSSIRILFGDSPAFQMLRLAVFVGVPVVLTWRLVLQVRTWRGTRNARRSSASEPTGGCGRRSLPNVQHQRRRL